MKKLTIVIPTYNEKENLERLVKQVHKVMESIDIETTIMVVDDGSPDGTGEIADRLADNFSQAFFKVRVIHRKGKQGLASAYIRGFKTAIEMGADYLMSMDADFSHNPKYIPAFLENIKKYDLVIGSRNVPGGSVKNWPFLRKIISKGGSLYSRIILGVNIKDFTGGFNMYKSKIFKDGKTGKQQVNLDKIRSDGYSFQIEMKYKIVKSGFTHKEIPIVFSDRKFGQAKMSKKIFIEAFFRVWQIRFGNDST